MTKTTISPKVDTPIAPGSLISATIRFVSNGCIVEWNHTPEKGKNGGMTYVDHAPNVFGSIEEACHAIVQAAGGNSEYVADDATEEAAEGEK